MHISVDEYVLENEHLALELTYGYNPPRVRMID